MDFQIDYGLFLAISNRKPGDQGDWKFDRLGIRSTLANGGGTVHEELMRHRHIECTKLDFPAMATELRRVEENLEERLTPDWFREVVACANQAKALKALEPAKAEAKREYDEALRKEVAAKTATFESRSEKVQAIAWAVQEANSAMVVLHGIELVERLVGNSASRNKAAARTKSDLMAVEIRDIRKANPGYSPYEIMAELGSRAGATNSCVVEKVADGVRWKNRAGGDEKLTMPALYSRLSRTNARKQ